MMFTTRKTIVALLITLLLSTLGFARTPHQYSAVDTIKLLAIGNSFSEDAIENYLHELAAAIDQPIIIGNLYIGGAPISLHVKNAMEDNASYSYRKITANGKKTTTEKVSLAHAIDDEKWTYISLQQASPLSGKFDVIMEGLPHLWTYVKAHAEDNTKLIYHQTWAYQSDSKHEGFVNYNSSQKLMYDSISSVSRKIAKSKDFDLIIPAGTAIQNLRTSSIGDHATRDGYHLELNYGRFTAACTWYEALFRQDVRKNRYAPTSVTPLQATIAKEAAHKANRRPYKVSRVRR